MISMNGPYVAELYSTFEDKNNIYLIMELCEGGDLFKAMLKHGGRLDEHHTCVEVHSAFLHRSLMTSNHPSFFIDHPTSPTSPGEDALSSSHASGHQAREYLPLSARNHEAG